MLDNRTKNILKIALADSKAADALITQINNAGSGGGSSGGSADHSDLVYAAESTSPAALPATADAVYVVTNSQLIAPSVKLPAGAVFPDGKAYRIINNAGGDLRVYPPGVATLASGIIYGQNQNDYAIIPNGATVDFVNLTGSFRKIYGVQDVEIYMGYGIAQINQPDGDVHITSSATIATPYYAQTYTVDASAGNVTITLPTVNGVPIAEMVFVRTDATSGNTVTILPPSGSIISGQSSYVLTGQYKFVRLSYYGGAYIVIGSN